MDLLQKVSTAQKNFNEALLEYHKTALLPIVEGKVQSDAVAYYGVLIDSLLDFVGHMEEYYSTRPEVHAQVMKSLETVSDHIAKIAGGRDWDRFLDG
jgi:hypothetical protein